MFDESIKSHISGLSDADLIEYARAGTEMYQEAAIDFAKKEISRRGIDASKMVVLEQELVKRDQVRTVEAKAAAEVPLGWTWRIILLVFGLPGWFLMIGVWLRFRENGERKKFHDVIFFGSIGIVLQIVAGITAVRLFSS